jgi:asparagine synthase (glutamine-hydrolysing)
MSGIVGIYQAKATALVENMLGLLQHRGPDGRGIHSDGQGGLGAVTLASSPSSHAGPLVRKERTIVWDGEVYNLAELQAASLEPAATDVALLLQLYEQEGVSFLERLDGPFALAILDGDELLLARDSMGQAPLYYGLVEDRLCFASEMKALQIATDDINVFPPGHVLQARQRRISLAPYRPRQAAFAADTDPEEIAAQLRMRLEGAVERRISDVDSLGVWLSGGLDSSAMAALACQLRNSHVRAFSAGMAGAPDLTYARETVAFLGIEHHECIYTVNDMLEALPRVIYYLESFDAPLVRSSVANYLVAKLASRHVRVVLSGEGGDELFAGYSYLKSEPAEGLPQALAQAQAALHNTALQRVDRSAAAHGTRARTCFLDPEVVAYANAIPARWKIYGEEKIEKWILRKALEGGLPESVLWRSKEKFWSGAGVADRLEEIAEIRISDEEFSKERQIAPDLMLNSKEELFYWRIFRQHFPHPAVLDCLGWTEHREGR